MQKVILVIDDDEMNLQIAKMILERKLSCEVISVSSGMAGIEVLRSQRVNLVLLDVMMPDLDGIETLKEIRADEKIKNVPVMMLTASGDVENVRRSAELGVRDYIKKPFMPVNLVKRVSDKLAEADKLTEHILAVGDDEKALNSVREFIEENFPHEVSIAANAEDAVKILAENNINLVVAMADMNFLDGFRVLNFMANNKKFAALPFVVTTQDKLAEIMDKITKVEETPPEVEEVPEVDEEPPAEEKVPEVDEKPPAEKETPKESPIVKEVPAEKVADSAKSGKEKKKLANVVTNLIGYELDVRV
ncbi:MAG: response regulator [Selenomonadaceae bacterium]|nr:response regulator [Selenomonadaceae bacterium]